MADAPEPKSYSGCALIGLPALLAPLVLFAIGLTGVTMSMVSLFSGGKELAPQKLSYGGVVDARMLSAMRETGAIGENEIPDAFHAENLLGTSACAISGGELIRVEGGKAQVMPLTAITSVEGTDSVVTARSDTSDVSILCRFGPDEGADRFQRMLEHR